MSRRRVSVKDLGQGDCQGWLYKRKESKGLLGWRWKKFWFVLKKCSLYWYTSDTVNQMCGFPMIMCVCGKCEPVCLCVERSFIISFWK